MTTKKQDEILHELYRRAYAASTPPADWDELLKNAETDDAGRKHIPFMEHECETETMENILTAVLKQYRVPKYLHQAFRTTFWLGCSPKSKSVTV